MSSPELNGHAVGFWRVAARTSDLNVLPHRLKFFFVDNQCVEPGTDVTENKFSAVIGGRYDFARHGRRQTNSYPPVDRNSCRRKDCTHDKIITSETRVGRFG